MRKNGRRLSIALTSSLLGCVSLTAPGAAADRTWVVDDDLAQCENAEFTSISSALADGRVVDGDEVRVCPGTYTGVGEVTKSVTLRGQPSAVDAEVCFQPPSALDDSVHAIVRPSDASAAPTGFDIRIGNVVVIGFVIDGWDIGVQTVDEQSGYLIAHNLVQRNRIGINIRSSGQTQSRLDRNCLRGNPDEGTRPALSAAVASEPETDGTTVIGQNLINARIDHNSTFQNREGIVFLGPGLRRDVVIDHNVMIETAQPPVDGIWGPTQLFPIAIGINNSTSVSILDNDITGPRFGVFAMGANRQLEVGRNAIRQGRQVLVGTVNAASFGIAFRTPAAGQDPNLDAMMYENVVTEMSIGIHAQLNALRSSEIVNNVTNSNASPVPLSAGDGIRLMSGNTGNTIAGNTASENSAYGIYAQLATGNTIEANTMLANGVADARDDTNPPQNAWIGNACLTDIPDGLCPTP